MLFHTQSPWGAVAVAKQKIFDERTDQSEVKARIVQKYFYAWANVIIPTAKTFDKKIAYIDLYAGPGRYRDGAASTPLLVLQRAIEDPNLREMLVTLLNDANKDYTDTLKAEIAKLPGIEKLKFAPDIQNRAVDEDAEKFFNETKLVPSFTFVDQFGYKGLSLRRVIAKSW
jgi:three-Cys-motif partner protein